APGGLGELVLDHGVLARLRRGGAGQRHDQRRGERTDGAAAQPADAAARPGASVILPAAAVVCGGAVLSRGAAVTGCPRSHGCVLLRRCRRVWCGTGGGAGGAARERKR